MKFPFPEPKRLKPVIAAERLIEDTRILIQRIENPIGSVDTVSALVRKPNALQWCTRLVTTSSALQGNTIGDRFTVSSDVLEFDSSEVVDFFYLRSFRLCHGESLRRLAAIDDEYNENRLQRVCIADHSVVDKAVWCLADAINDGDLPKIAKFVKGSVDVTRVFAVRGPLQVSMKRHTPLSYATSNGRSQQSLHLVNLGASIEIADGQGNLPIHWACIRGLTKFVSHCLSLVPSQASARTDDGYSTLFLATENENYEIMRMLIEAGADVNERHVHEIPRGGKMLYSPVLATGLSFRAAKVLREHKADFSMRNLEGQTALHIAAINGDRVLYNYLLEIGCREDDADTHGRTANYYLKGK